MRELLLLGSFACEAAAVESRIPGTCLSTRKKAGDLPLFGVRDYGILGDRGDVMKPSALSL